MKRLRRGMGVEAMDHPYFFPIVKEQGRLNAMSVSPTTANSNGNNATTGNSNNAGTSAGGGDAPTGPSNSGV